MQPGQLGDEHHLLVDHQGHQLDLAIEATERPARVAAQRLAFALEPGKRLPCRGVNSLAFNLTAVDTTPEMGRFEIAPGTHWEPGLDFEQQMFPAEREWPRYAALGQRKLPRRGDLSARSALTIHRGTANCSDRSRPVLVLGVDGPGAGHAELHDLQVTPDYYEALPAIARRHLHCRVVERLRPIVQKHQIEGLSAGAA